MTLICTVLQIYWLVILARMFLSWVRVTPGTPLASVSSVVFNLTEPVLGPLRRMIPPMRMGVTPIDLSPLVVLLALLILC